MTTIRRTRDIDHREGFLPAIFRPLAGPLLGVIVIGLRPLIDSESNYLLFTEPNAVTLTIFFGMLSFVTFAVLGLATLYLRWDQLTSRGTRIIFTFTSVAVAALAVIFLYHGMVSPVWTW